MIGASERPTIIQMRTTSRPQQRYDHRLRDLVRRTGDLTVATDLGVPRSTARAWLRAAPTVVVSLDVADLTEPELRQEILRLRHRVEKLAALLRLALALLQASGFSLSGERLPAGQAKRRILRAVDQARACLPLRAVLRFLGLSPSRFHAWCRRLNPCALDDQLSCPRTSPHRLTCAEVQAIGNMVTSPEYVTSRPARSRSSRSGSAPSQRRHRPGACQWRIRNSCSQPSLRRARVAAILAEAMCPLGFTHARGTRGRTTVRHPAFRNWARYGRRARYAAIGV